MFLSLKVALLTYANNLYWYFAVLNYELVKLEGCHPNTALDGL